MATRKISNVDSAPDTEKQTFEFDNGDLQAMASIEVEWKFLNKESLLRFALAVLSRAKNKIVYIMDANGVQRPLSPSSDLLKLQNPETPTGTPPNP